MKGCACETCGSPLSEVVETRNNTDYVRRRRKCFNGHVFTTHEYTVPEGMVPLPHARIKVQALLQFVLKGAATDRPPGAPRKNEATEEKETCR